MKIYREVGIPEDNIYLGPSILVGDRIKVKLPDRTYFATAIESEKDNILFLFDDYLDEAMQMNARARNKGGYNSSDLRKHLQGLEEEFPEELRKRMLPFENGDKIRVLSLPEICGLDENFNECDGQIEWLKQLKHRVAYRQNKCEFGWTTTVFSGGSNDFAIIDEGGSCYRYYLDNDGYFMGVRPVFRISCARFAYVKEEDRK